MRSTINEDLTSHTILGDNELECFLPNYNPETLVHFTSVAEVEAFIASITNMNYFTPYKSPEDREVEATAAFSESVRTERNALLAASDWTQVEDVSVDKAAWATYRQALRDVTTQDGFPDTVVWPVKP